MQRIWWLAVAAVPVAALAALIVLVAVVLAPEPEPEVQDYPAAGDVMFDPDGSTFVDRGGSPNAWGGYSNGQIPSSELCALSWSSQRLRCDAAAALERLNSEFAAVFGSNLAVTDGYRSYAEQVAVKLAKGLLAATPGTSNHGWGLAADLGSGVNKYDTEQYQWMKANGSRFGWFHPTWAEPGHADYAKAEPWHWQYVPGAVEAMAGGSGSVSGNRALGQQAAAGRGWSGEEWSCLDQLWQRESGWNHLADNPTSSAYGIPQALPGSKMASRGADWLTNPSTQIAWGLDYIAGRYGTPCTAWAHSQQTGWY